VQTDQSLSLSPNYIESLLAARDLVKEVRFHGQTLEQPPPHTLLHLLLRHSMLLEYTGAASRLLIKRGLLPPALRREPELVDLPLGQLMQTVWRQMAKKISVADAGEMELGEYLLGFTPSGEPDLAREPDLKPLSEFRASLSHLKSLDVDRLEKLMAGTLDLCSHRLDAWITSLATKRLAELRKANPTGVLFGGYGWVMNLKPADAQTKVTPPPGEPDPVFQATNNPGFVHAPSLTQASTVAILRSGHLTHAGAAGQTANDLLAIDLSSERVRLATWLLDGVRQGQPLGALLGYRFERRLQEVRKAQFFRPSANSHHWWRGSWNRTNQSIRSRSKPSPPTTSWMVWPCCGACKKRRPQRPRNGTKTQFLLGKRSVKRRLSFPPLILTTRTSRPCKLSLQS